MKRTTSTNLRLKVRRLEPPARWAASAVTVFVLLAWILSTRWIVVLATPPLWRSNWAGIGFGQNAIVLAWTTSPAAGSHPGKTLSVFSGAEQGGRGFWSPQIATTPAGQQVIAPFWICFLLSLAIAAWLWWRWRRLQLLRRPGSCGACGYDRTGLVSGAACPECGADDAPI